MACEIEMNNPLNQCQYISDMSLVAKDNISPEENQKLRELAVKIAFEIQQKCGPFQLSSVDGKKHESKEIRAFNGKKAAEIIHEMIWNFLTRGY